MATPGRSPLLSVVIPSYNRARELRRCLQGFARQEADPASFEVVVADDGSDVDYSPLREEFGGGIDLRILRLPHLGVSAARNEAIGAARADLLLLLDDDFEPLPALVADCIAFHQRYPAEADLALIHFEAEPAVMATPLWQYLAAQGPVFQFPPAPGVYGHEFFWGGATTCKRSLFERGLFTPGMDATEDTELGARLARQAPLRVHYEPIPRMVYTRPLTIDALQHKEYLLAYHRYFRRFDVDWLAGAYTDDPRYATTHEFLVSSFSELEDLRTSVAELESLVISTGADDRIALHRAELHAIYDRLIGHAMARGWRDATLGRPPDARPCPVAPAGTLEETRLPDARWRRQQGRPLLTASLITRDEAQHIEECLASLQSVAGEVVIVDTGSTDGTVEIARACGARVEVMAWADDFSAARNRSLELATGEWILYIDADERLRAPDVGALEAALQSDDHAGLMVLLRAREGTTPFWEMRLFRNDPSIRFQGVIHETVWPSLLAYGDRMGRGIGHSELSIEHLGYAGDQAAKHRRNLPLLLRSLGDEPWKVFNWSHLAMVHDGLGDEANAELAWQRALEAARAMPPGRLQDSMAFSGYLEWLSARNRPYEEVLREGLERYPDNLYLWWVEALRLLAMESWEQAAQAFESVLAGADATARDQSMGYSEDMFGPPTVAALASCLFQLERYDEAAMLYRDLERDHPDNLEMRTRRMLSEGLAARTAATPAP